jgi:ABC-type branched-subunit amino acid transport system ATPase component
VILEVNHLKKSFGNIEAIKDVSLYINENEVLGIIGPNGAGKTTMFNLIMGTYHQDEGRIVFLNTDIGGMKTYKRVVLGIARTFQFARNFTTISVIEHIRIALLSDRGKSHLKKSYVTEQEALKISEKVKLQDAIMKLPGELNIEELRKLELAMAMAVKPKLLLIDEMFAGLTREESNEIISIIKGMMREGNPTTVMIIDHNLSALSSIADRVIAIDLGLKIAEGSFNEVCADEKVKRAYLGEFIQ